MEVKCPKCGHKFDPMGEVLVDCPCCEFMIDTRTILEEHKTHPDRRNSETRGLNEPFSVKDLRDEKARDPRSSRKTDNSGIGTGEEYSEFWESLRQKDIDDSVEYCASPKWKEMSERDRQRRSGIPSGGPVFLAGLAIPGAGHLAIRRPLRGLFLFFAAIIAGIVGFYLGPSLELPSGLERGYLDLPPNLYEYAIGVLIDQIKYPLIALGSVHLISIIDLLVLLKIGPKPKLDPGE
ncbi:MAG: hypothetical protein JW941_01690 [Candidatus Coatesbacteria bacterium]|nr:hypothetical protein [Candidatus Coatesbacteria bacterium]